jgi:hypothetical protein
VDADDVDELEEEETDEAELEADEEIDKDRQASDEREIQELADEVDTDICFFVGASDLELGRSAMTKVHGKSVRVFHELTSHW